MRSSISSSVPSGLSGQTFSFAWMKGQRYVVDTLELPDQVRQTLARLRGLSCHSTSDAIAGIPRLGGCAPRVGSGNSGSCHPETSDPATFLGYLDATANVHSMTFEKNLASLSIRVVPGVCLPSRRASNLRQPSANSTECASQPNSSGGVVPLS